MTPHNAREPVEAIPGEKPDWFEEAFERAKLFVHATPICEHEFSGWRDFEDGNGGEQFCQKCGLGAMSYSMRYLP